LACVYLLVEKPKEALKILNKALIIDPTNIELRWVAGNAYMAIGDFDNALPRMEMRSFLSNAKIYGHKIQSKPMWDGQPTDETIFIWSEQGFGDTIQMLRYLPLIKAKLIVEVDAQLIRLCRRNFPNITFIRQGEEIPVYDLQCSLMSLPYLFRTNRYSIPKAPYLSINQELIEHWGERLRVLPKGPKLGLVWKGNILHGRDNIRSIPFDAFNTIAEDYNFVSLQWEENLFEDFADTAALMKNLDLIITIDSAPAHLAGALGIPTWMLIPMGCDPRWMYSKPTTPWYPTMRIFDKKSEKITWSSLLETVRSELIKIYSPQLVGIPTQGPWDHWADNTQTVRAS